MTPYRRLLFCIFVQWSCFWVSSETSSPWVKVFVVLDTIHRHQLPLGTWHQQTYFLLFVSVFFISQISYFFRDLSKYFAAVDNSLYFSCSLSICVLSGLCGVGFCYNEKNFKLNFWILPIGTTIVLVIVCAITVTLHTRKIKAIKTFSVRKW